MAIPTQFSVTNTNVAPIANPPLAKDLPKVIEAEEHSLVDGASIIPSLSSAGVSAPQELTAETAVVIANPSAKTSQAKASVDAPVEKTAQAKTVNPAPSVLTPKTGTLTAPPFPLNHARVLYENLLSSSAVVSTGGAGDAFVLNPNTWQRWTFGASSDPEIIFTLPVVTPMDTFCIGAHNLNSIGSTVDFYYDTNLDGPIEFVLGTVPPSSDGAIMLHLDSKPNVRRLRIVVRGGGGDAFIGYISAGIALQMQRPFFNGHRPFTDSDVTEYYANRTESGERIGRQIRRKGFETSFEWSNLDDGWYRQYIPEFKEFAKRVPVFLAWNLLEYPDDVAFGDITEDFGASMQNGTATKRSGLSFTIAGVG